MMWKVFRDFVSPFISPYLAIGLIIAVTGLFTYHKIAVYSAFREGRAAEKKAATIEAANRIATMEKEDAEFRKLSPYQRCVVFLRDSGLSSDNCVKR